MFKMLKKKLKDQRGLKLIELLAVIVILGIIAAIAIPSIGNIITNSKKDAIRADAKLILNAASLYQTENTTTTGDTITIDELTPEYIDGITTIVATDEYTVKVTATGLIISGQGTKDGVTLDFGDTATAGAGKSLEEIDTVN